MSDQNDLLEAKEEAEFLRKRAWDFIAKLEKLESEFKKTTDADKRQSLQTRIKNTRRLLSDYQVEHKALCEEAGLTPESFTPNAPSRDIIASLSRKTLRTREDLKRGQRIDLPPFFLAPSRNPKFTGRQSEVREFIQRVLQGGAFAICGVKGMGGIGKSEIAKEVCHLFHETWQDTPQLPEYVADLLTTAQGGLFRDGMLWIQFEPEDQTPKTLTEYLIPKLAEPSTAEKIPDLDALAEVLADKDVLVVLDSVEQNLRTFDYVLERFKGKFPLIITSRVAIPGIHAVDIDMLRDAEAEMLFIAHLGNPEVTAGQRETIRELCRLLDNYPLILKIIASRVTTDHSNLTELKTAYQANRALLLEESGCDTGIEQRNVSVTTCFAMSFHSMDEPEQRAFLHSALFSNPFTVSALAALLDDANEEEMQHSVKRLTRLSLLNRLKGQGGQEPTYDLHPLMREFALNLLLKQVETIPGKKEEIAALLETLKDKNKHNTLLESLQDHALVQLAVEAMLYCDRVFNFATVLDFMNVLNPPLDRLGLWEKKIRLNRLAVRAAVALQQRSNEAFWLGQLAATLQRRAVSSVEQEQVRRVFAQALRIERELKRAERIISTQYFLAYIEQSLQHWTAAIRSNYQGIRDACRHGEFYWLGAFVRTLGNVHDAFLNEQSGIFFHINYKLQLNNTQQDWQKWNLLRAYDDNIEILYNQGQILACVPRYQQQLQLAKTLESAELVAYSIQNLFNCYLVLQDPQACQFYLQAYIKISAAMGLAESTRLSMIGRFAWLSGDYDAAVRAFLAALAEADLSQDHYHYWLGKSYLHQGDLDKAAEYLNLALNHHRTQKNAVEMAKAYSQLALLALKRGDTRQAVEYFSTSLKTQQAHGIEISPEEVQIEHAIREQLAREESGLYDSLAAQAQAIDLEPDFLLPELPQAYTGQDGKPMLLIPAGPVFIGKGVIENPTTEELLDNIEQYLYPYRQHSGNYQVPPHPDTIFDEDQLLFLLEQSQSMTEEQKLEVLAKIPESSEDGIHQLIRLLQQKYDVTHLKATEIYLYPYYIDREPVSNAEYQSFCAATKHPYPSHWPEGKYPDNAADLPVVNISMEDAKAYALWAGKEIPTAPEWEKACRGELGVVYPWGNEWDVNQVKAKDGAIRKQFEAEYLEMNATMPEHGGMSHFKTPRFTLPPHQHEFDEAKFLSYLQGSISLSVDEKRRIVESLPKLSQYQVDELLKIFSEEKTKFLALDKIHESQLNALRREHYNALMQPELAELYLNSLHEPTQNESAYGVRDLTGSIYHLTVTESDEWFAIKGGSWFSENPQEACQAWAVEWIKARDKRMDTGFRCVKPIFGREDLPDGKLAP